MVGCSSGNDSIGGFVVAVGVVAGDAIGPDWGSLRDCREVETGHRTSCCISHFANLSHFLLLKGSGEWVTWVWVRVA